MALETTPPDARGGFVSALSALGIMLSGILRQASGRLVAMREVVSFTFGWFPSTPRLELWMTV